MPTPPRATRAALPLAFFLVSACGHLSRANDPLVGPDGRSTESADGNTASFPAPRPPPPTADVRTVASTFDDAPLTIVRSEPLGTLRVNARVQLARGTDATWAILGSDGASAAPLFWMSRGADHIRMVRGQEGLLLGGELALLVRASNDGSTPATATSDRLRALGPNGWSAPRTLTPEQAEAARRTGSVTPVDARAAFTLDAGGVRHAFRWEPNALVWSSGGEERTLCACDDVVHADVDPADGSPTLVVHERGGAFVYRFANGGWSRVELVPPAGATPDPSTCEVDRMSDDATSTLPPACSFFTHAVLGLGATRFPTGSNLHAVWVETVRDVQLQCVRQRHACDPSGPDNPCGPSESWSCGQAARSRTTSSAQATIAGGAVRVAALDGLVAAGDDAVSLALQADDDAAHIAITSGDMEKGVFPVRHIELGPKGAKMREARPVREIPPADGPFASEDSLLAFGFSGFGAGVFDGGALELRSTAYRGAQAPSTNFQWEAEAQFGASEGHGIEIGGGNDSLVLLVDATHATLDEHEGRTESLGPLERVYSAGWKNFDASTRHKYTVSVAGERVTVSIDGAPIGTGDIRGGVQSIRFGCVGNCYTTPSSVWSALTVARH